jgi:hypothetical protein
LREFQKADFRDKSPEQKWLYYRDAMIWLKLDNAKETQTALNNYLALNSIFLTEDLRKEFRDMNISLQKALLDEEVAARFPRPGDEDSVVLATALGKISNKFDEIGSAVQKRLRYEDA